MKKSTSADNTGQVMEKPAIRRPDGTFAPGHPGTKPKGAISKHRRKLKELVEQEADGDPLPVKMARIGRRAEDAGDDALALTAYAAAAQYIYGKVKPREEPNDEADHGLPSGTTYLIVAADEDPTPRYPGQRVLIDPTRVLADGKTINSMKVGSDGKVDEHRITFVEPGDDRPTPPGTTVIDFKDAM